MTAASSQRRRLGERSLAAAFICRNVHVEFDMSSLVITLAPCLCATPCSGCSAVDPCTGYELTQWFDSSLSNAWHASHSQIYPELAKLEAEGLVEVVGEGARRCKTWAVTDAGREELRRWLIETEPNRAQRNETALRWFLVFRLEPERAPRGARARAGVRRAPRPSSAACWPTQLDAEGKTRRASAPSSTSAARVDAGDDRLAARPDRGH